MFVLLFYKILWCVKFMVLDLKVNRNGETQWNGEGDFDVVDGTEQIGQSIYISIITNVDLVLESFASKHIESLRSEIYDAVDSNPQTEQPINVYASIEESDDNDPYVQFDILTNSTQFVATATQ